MIEWFITFLWAVTVVGLGMVFIALLYLVYDPALTDAEFHAYRERLIKGLQLSSISGGGLAVQYLIAWQG